MQKIMTEKERMLSEKLYIPMDEALAADCARSRRLVRLITVSYTHLTLPTILLV